MIEKGIERWWDATSEYYQKEISGDKMDDVHYGPFGSSEKKLRLLGNVKGKKILELGCGGGQVSIALAKKGAICTGIDISLKQLQHAEKAAEKNKVNVKFMKLSISDLSGFKSSSYDIVISIFALQYVKDLTSVSRQVKRLLNRGGIFVFSLDNPFYLTVNPNTLEVSKSYNKTGLSVENETWPDGSRHKFMIYKRKVSDIANAIISSG